MTYRSKGWLSTCTLYPASDREGEGRSGSCTAYDRKTEPASLEVSLPAMPCAVALAGTEHDSVPLKAAEFMGVRHWDLATWSYRAGVATCWHCSAFNELGDYNVFNDFESRRM